MILKHTVTSFLISDKGKQLSSKRVLFHLPERLSGYQIESQRIIQSILPPVSVALCPTSFCVRQCNFCSNTQRNKEKRQFNAQYSDDTFRQIIEDLNNLKILGVSVAGGGEPLVYDKSVFTHFLTHQNPSFKIGIHTNGVLLEKILTQEVITAGNIQYINVSVVAHETELYKRVCGASSEQFAKIEKNLK